MVLTRVKWPNVVLMMVVDAHCARTGSGRGRAAMWARVWLTLAAVETERLAPQESTRRQEPEEEAEVSEIVIVSDAVDGTSVDLDDKGVDVPEETAELVKLVSQERVQQRIAEVQVEFGGGGLTGTSATAEAQFTEDFFQERISERTQIVDVPVPQIFGGVRLTKASATADRRTNC